MTPETIGACKMVSLFEIHQARRFKKSKLKKVRLELLIAFVDFLKKKYPDWENHKQTLQSLRNHYGC